MHARLSTTPLVLCATILETLVASAALATPGALVQLDGPDGCISKDGAGGACAVGRGLGGALDLALSPDGKSLYVASFSDDAIAVFARNKSASGGPIGRLTQLAGQDGCVSETGSNGACTKGKALDQPFAVAVSRDRTSVYVAGSGANAIAALWRDPETGRLTQLPEEAGCVSEDGSGGACVDGKGLGRPVGLTVTPNGKHVYVTANDTASLATFARDTDRGPLRGALAPASCLSSVDGATECTESPLLGGALGMVTSPDGRHVYVASQGGHAVLAFKRNARTGALTPLEGTAACISADGTDGACVKGRGLVGARAIAISRNGKNVYVASEFGNSVAVFARNRKTGELTQLEGTDGCVGETSLGGACADGKALLGPRGIAVSRDGRNVYVGAAGSHAVAVFARDRRTGALTQLPGTEGCVSEDGTGGECADGTALRSAGAVAVSDDGKSVYVASLQSGAVAVFARQKR